MNALAQLQGAFQDYVLEQGEAAPDLLAAVRRQGRLDPAARLAIYRHAYRARMREALCEAFERTWTYIGDDLFDQMASAYLDAHPSTFSNLRWFGGGFPAFIAETLAAHPFVAELAAFEWTLGLAFDAPDAPAVHLDSLRALAPQEWAALRFALHPSVHLLPLLHNSVALWQALGEERAPPDPAPLAEPLTWLVWRHALQPHFRSLDSFEAGALRALAQGASLGEICAGCDADAAPRVAACLRDWLGTGMLRAADDGKPATLVATGLTFRPQHENDFADPPGQQDHRGGGTVGQT
jgi:hypothetical protein